MKKSLILSLCAAAIFIGCGSKNQTTPQTKECVIENQEAPVWICAPKDTKEYITAVGSAEKSPLGFSFQRTEALAAARDELARRISVKVKNIFKRYESNVGVQKNKTTEKVVENVSKQLADITLRDSKILATWQSKNGTLYVLVGVPKKNLEEGIKSSLSSKDALYQKYIANKEWEKLDKEIKAEFGE
jgi:hypothetical protein